MTIRTLLITAGLTLAFAGCSKSKFDKVLAGESDWKDKICACTDKDCADKTYKDYKTWEEESQKDFTEDDIKGVSASSMEKAEAIEKDLKACHKKFNKE